jgi:hypothetical protein
MKENKSLHDMYADEMKAEIIENCTKWYMVERPVYIFNACIILTQDSCFFSSPDKKGIIFWSEYTQQFEYYLEE